MLRSAIRLPSRELLVCIHYFLARSKDFHRILTGQQNPHQTGWRRSLPADATADAIVHRPHRFGRVRGHRMKEALALFRLLHVRGPIPRSELRRAHSTGPLDWKTSA